MAACVKVCGCRPHEGGAAHTGAGVRKPPREETAEDVAGGASGAMGISASAVYRRGGLGAFSAGDRGRYEAGRSIARGRIGVVRRRWNDTVTIVSSATASMVIADR